MTYFSEIVHLSDIARVHGKRCPSKKAFIFEDRVVTYKEFDINSERVANGLVSENVADQDRVAYMDKNSDRVSADFLNWPDIALVEVKLFCFSTPLICIHI